MKIINVKTAKGAFRFKLSSKGLYLAPKKQPKYRISGWIKVAGLATYENGTDLFVIVQTKNDAGEVQTHRISRGDFRRKERLMEMLAVQWRDNAKPDDEVLLFAYLTSFKPSLSFVLLPRGGWYENAYVFPDVVVGKASLIPVYTPPADIPNANTGCGGTLTGWKQGVGRLAKYSDRLTFCVSASFAGLILKHISGERSCTFHLFGSAGNGKTTSQLAAQSVHGPAERDQLPHWAVTSTRLDELAAAHSDRVLVLDEIVRLGENDRQITDRAREASYKIANGVGRLRSVHFGKAGNPTSWRTIAISSGEFSLHEKAQMAGQERMEGDLVRLIDIPVVASKEYGIFNKLPPKYETSAQAVAALEASASANYGYPSRAFVSAFVENIQANAAEIEKSIKVFMKKAKVPADKWEQRFARKFAVVYAAGVFAVRHNLVPWTVKWVRQAIKRCYRAARREIPDYGKLLNGAVAAIRKALTKPGLVIDLTRGKVKPSTVAAAAAFLKKDPKQGEFFAIRPEIVESWIGDKVTLSAVLQKLDKDKLLLKTQPKIMTKPVLIAGIKGKPRYVCVRRAGLFAA